MPQLFRSKPTAGNKEQMPDCRFQQSDCLRPIKVISDLTGQLIGFDVSSVKGHQIHSHRPGDSELHAVCRYEQTMRPASGGRCSRCLGTSVWVAPTRGASLASLARSAHISRN